MKSNSLRGGSFTGVLQRHPMKGLEMTDPGSDTPQASPPKKSSDYWALVAVSTSLIVAFLGLHIFLLLAADEESTTDVVWNRFTTITNGVEAIVFTAVGWLFGREVNKGTAEVAKTQADSAQRQAAAAMHQIGLSIQQAEAAKSDAEAGREIAGLVRGLAMQNSDGTGAQDGGGTRGIMQPQPPASPIEALLAEVDRLFPPTRS